MMHSSGSPKYEVGLGVSFDRSTGIVTFTNVDVTRPIFLSVYGNASGNTSMSLVWTGLNSLAFVGEALATENVMSRINFGIPTASTITGRLTIPSDTTFLGIFGAYQVTIQ